MNMTEYLDEIEYAAANTIDSIWAENKTIDELTSEITRLKAVVEDNYQRANDLKEHSEDADDVMLGVGVYWENYFGEDKELYYKNKELTTLQSQVLTHKYSIAALSGSLLQNAKQGISAVHGGLAASPDGRLIGTQPLKTIIWQSRNQSMHWEDGTFHPPATAAFQTLISEIDPSFSDYTVRDMAFDVIELLGWRDFNSFKSDMLTLQ